MSAFPAFGPKADTHHLTTPEGVTMRVITQGEGPSIVFVPGGDQPAEAYTQLFARLSGGFRCVTYDPRGAGQTASPPPPWAIADYAQDCARVNDAFCDGRAVVCGLSLGGLVTQATAIDFPQKVRADTASGCGPVPM
jgi:3-oxoadipate enol-lactonase